MDRTTNVYLDYIFLKVVKNRDLLNRILSYHTNGYHKFKYWISLRDVFLIRAIKCGYIHMIDEFNYVDPSSPRNFDVSEIQLYMIESIKHDQLNVYHYYKERFNIELNFYQIFNFESIYYEPVIFKKFYELYLISNNLEKDQERWKINVNMKLLLKLIDNRAHDTVEWFLDYLSLNRLLSTKDIDILLDRCFERNQTEMYKFIYSYRKTCK